MFKVDLTAQSRESGSEVTPEIQIFALSLNRSTKIYWLHYCLLLDFAMRLTQFELLHRRNNLLLQFQVQFLHSHLQMKIRRYLKNENFTFLNFMTEIWVTNFDSQCASKFGRWFQPTLRYFDLQNHRTKNWRF